MKRYTDKEILEDIAFVIKTRGRTSKNMYKLYGRYHINTVCRRFKSWSNAVKTAKEGRNNGDKLFRL